ncbi:MAG: hypothetical protein JJ902_10845 [Roseibium sp.]|nr:hypothetical protein [Roseibium sp.]
MARTSAGMGKKVIGQRPIHWRELESVCVFVSPDGDGKDVIRRGARPNADHVDSVET